MQVEAIRSGQDMSTQKSSHATIFPSLLESKLPAIEKSIERLRDEAFSLVTAGSITTSVSQKRDMETSEVLTHARTYRAQFFRSTTYYIAANPSIRMKLLEELKTVMPKSHDRPELSTLEQLPYLTAIIHEGLRISHGVAHRIMRVFPDKTLRYGRLEIPSGTIVSMTSLLIHENEAIFPEPKVFRPERWLHGDQVQLHRYLIPFSRGTRGCLGINLAWAEMYLVLASIFRRFDFDLSQVVRERDIDCIRDCLTGESAFDSKGIIVKILQGSD